MTTEKKQALDGARLNAFAMDPADLMIISDRKHPLFRESAVEPIPEEYVAAIMAKGVIEAVIVRKVDGDPVVIDGRKRVRGALEANKRLKAEGAPLIFVPVMIRKGDETDAVEVMGMLNAIRTEDSVFEKARWAQRLSQLGRTDDQIAALAGVTKQTVQSWDKLLALAPAVQRAVEAGEITVATAVKEIGKLPITAQTAALETKPKVTAKDRKRAGGRRAASTRANKATMRKVAESDALNAREKALAGFFLGTVGKGDLLTKIPGLKAGVS